MPKSTARESQSLRDSHAYVVETTSGVDELKML